MANEDFYNKYMQFLSQEPPSRKMDKGTKLGLIGTVLASALTRSTEPTERYMGTVNMLQEQQDYQRELMRQNYLDQMNALEFQGRMRRADLEEKIRQRDLEKSEREELINQKRAEQQLGQFYKSREEDLKYQQKLAQGQMKLMDMASTLAQKVAGSGYVGKKVGGAIEGTRGRVEEGLGKTTEELGGLETQRTADVEYAGLGPEQLQQVRYEKGIMTPLEKEQYEYNKKKNALGLTEAEQKIEINRQIIEENQRAAAMGDQGAEAFLDLLDNGQFSQEYSPKAKADAVQKYQSYRANEKTIRLMGTRPSGGEQPANGVGSVVDMAQWSKMTNQMRSDYVAPLTEAFRYNNMDYIQKFANAHAKSDPMLYDIMITKALADSGSIMDDKGLNTLAMENIAYQTFNKKGEPSVIKFNDIRGKERTLTTLNDEYYQDAAKKWAGDNGWVREKNMWVMPNSAAQDYLRNPQKYKPQFTSGAGQPSGNGLPTKAGGEIIRGNAGEVIPDITSTEWDAAIKEVEGMEQDYSAEELAKFVLNPGEARIIFREAGLDEVTIEYILDILNTKYGNK